MFNIFFGWRKASKCKKLIQNFQFHLELVKNERNFIVRQLREDIAILLKDGHQQTAFDRAEQLFKNECELAVYELLDKFCFIIIINFSYIRKLKECPDDINQAVSTLIFASSIVGDLPELKKIKEVFEERYGKRFVTVALELLPGNLVNQQMINHRRRCRVQVVPDEVKFRVLSEIAGKCFNSGPLLVDYKAQSLHHVETEECSVDETRNGDIVITDTEAKMAHIDSSAERKNLIKDSKMMQSLKVHCPPYKIVLHPRLATKNNQDEVNGVAYNEVSLSAKSSLDDIEEYLYVRIGGIIQEQRVFKFSLDK